MCDAFHADPTRNPFTGRPIQPGKKTFLELQRRCGVDEQTRCQEFRRSPDRNPFTNRPIQRNKPVYQRLTRQCGDPFQSDLSQSDSDTDDDSVSLSPRLNRGRLSPASDRTFIDSPPLIDRSLDTPIISQPPHTPSVSKSPIKPSFESPKYGEAAARPTSHGVIVEQISESDELKQALKTRMPLSNRTEYQTFIRNPVRNPATGHRISRDGAVYRRLAKKYGEVPPPEPFIKTDSSPIHMHMFPNQEHYLQEVRTKAAKRRREIAGLFGLYESSKRFDFDLHIRRARAEAVNETLRDFNFDKWNYCISTGGAFRNKLDEWRLVGSGTFGNVFTVKYKGAIFTIKEAFIENEFKKANLKYSPRGTQKWDEWVEDTYPEEFDFQRLVNEALKKFISPHFIYTIGGGLCHNCALSLNKDVYQGTCYTIAMETADSNLDVLFNQQTLSPAIIANFIQQLLLGTAVLHGRFGIVHRDIKSQNILVRAVRPGGHFQYRYPGRMFYLANMGYVLMLSDYGVSWMTQSAYNKRNRFYGTRNAVFKRTEHRVGWGKDAGVEYQLQPFNTKYYPWFGPDFNKVIRLEHNRYFRTWYDGDKRRPVGQFTVNRLCDVDLKPDASFDLTNMRALPAWEFAGDIQDVLRTFIGGKRFYQPGNHPGVKQLDFRQTSWFQRVMKIGNLTLDQTELYNVNGRYSARYLLADVTIAHLFPETNDTLWTRTVDNYQWSGF